MDKLQEAYKRHATGKDDSQLNKLVENSERIMGPPAKRLLSMAGLDASTKEPFSLLDDACGAGSLTSQLHAVVHKDVLEKSRIVCADINEPMLSLVKKRTETQDWINTEDSKLPQGSFTHVIVNFGLHVIPDPDAVLRDILRILRPGGVLAWSTMHQANRASFPDIRSAFHSISREIALPETFPVTANDKPEWADPEASARKLAEHGFENVEVEIWRQTQRIESAEDFVECFGSMITWLASMYMTEKQRSDHQDTMMGMITDHLREKYDGKSWDLSWTMILSKSTAPSA